MGDRRCCCTCPFWEDHFTRANSTNLGPDWREVAGDSFIESERLKLTYALRDGLWKSGLVICEHTPQGDQLSQIIKVSIYNRVLDDVHRIVLNYVDEDNFAFVSFYRGVDDASSTVSLRTRIAGSESVILSKSHKADANLRITVCYDGGAILVSDETTNLLFHGAFGIGAAGYFHSGLQGGAPDAPIYFDDWYISEGWLTNSKCPRCCCWCDKTALGRRLTLSIEGLGVAGQGSGGPGRMATWFDGRSCWLDVDETFPCGRWEQKPANNDDLFYPSDPAYDPLTDQCPPIEADLHPVLFCDSGGSGPIGLEAFSLTINGQPTTMVTGNSSCSPLYLEFTSGDLGACNWTPPPDPPAEHNVLIYKITG